MNIQSLLLLQLAIDILLCLLLGLFLWQFGRRKGKQPRDHGGADMDELRKFMEESRKLSADFVAALEEGRKNLKSLAFSLDERERRLQDLLVRAGDLLKPESREGKSAPVSKSDPYRQVLKMIDDGHTDQEVTESLGVTTGEIELIKNLDRRRNQETS